MARLEAFRLSLEGLGSASFDRARRSPKFDRLVRFVEWKLIEMPLPRLQVVGGVESRFLYEIAWTQEVKERTVRAYQRDQGGAFDNRILLKPGVGEQLVQLNGLLRPLLHHRWAGEVAGINSLDEYRLEEFLFGVSRIALDEVREPLLEAQDRSCFYCARRLTNEVEVDHFLPWARYRDNGLANLVLADRACNQRKRDFLAATEHVERWAGRLAPGPSAGQLEAVAARLAWAWEPAHTVSVARAIYLRLPGDSLLWARADRFERPDPVRLRTALGR